jgi:predicted hotdog family 3-hydroxylacyl-ACP dehydratase
MEFEKIDILEIIPQRPPFVMVDKLIYCDKETTKTALRVREDNIFVENGCLSAPGLIENIAQTCASRMGYINKYIYNETVKIGFIGAIRNQDIVRLPVVSETLITQIKTVEEVFQMTLVTASVHIDSELITSCEMKIAITDIDGKQE